MKSYKTFLDEAKDWKSLPDDYWVLVQGRKVIKSGKTKPKFTSSKGQELMTVKYAKKMMMEAGFGKHQGKVDKKAVMKKYKENEDNNAHTENYLMLAKFYGTEDEVDEVKKIMKRSKSSTSQKDMDWMYKNINKYYKKLK